MPLPRILSTPMLIAGLLAGMATPSPAQEAEGDAAPREAKGRLAWFVYTDLPENLENPVKVLTGSKLTEVTLSKRMASGPVKVPGDGIVRIVRENKGADAKDKPYLVFSQTVIPEGVSKALIILFPLSKPNGDLLFNTKVQNLANFKGGDTLYMNLTKLPVAVEIGDAKVGINPGEIRIHEAPRSAEPVNVPVSYNFRDQEGRWRMLSASTIVLQPTRREICIFSVDPQLGRIDYHGVTFPVEAD